jgi:hypothetical protein
MEVDMSTHTGLRILTGLLLAVLLIAGAAAIGYLAYANGVAAGVAQAGGQAPTAVLAPVPYYGYPMAWYHPFGFLGCLAPLFFLFLVFFAMRLVFGGFGYRRHGPWGWRGGPWGSDEMRSHFREKAEQWHREMHASGDAGEQKAS